MSRANPGMGGSGTWGGGAEEGELWGAWGMGADRDPGPPKEKFYTEQVQRRETVLDGLGSIKEGLLCFL